MFCSRFFPARMFARRFFPKVGAAATGVFVRRTLFRRVGSRGIEPS